jgi:hypothetical protein
LRWRSSLISKTEKEKKYTFGFKPCPYIIGDLDNILFCYHARNSAYFTFLPTNGGNYRYAMHNNIYVTVQIGIQ